VGLKLKLDSTLKEMGFQQSAHKVTVYWCGKGHSVLVVEIYVDDLIITGIEEAVVEAFKAQMKATFQMGDLSLLCFYLDIEVHQDDSGITLYQPHYAKHINEILQRGRGG
jgi:hypothetical protein